MFIGFGNEDELKHFAESHQTFIQKINPLFDTFHKVFTRKIDASAPNSDKVVFHLGLLCVEDFKELLLLCSNGYGIGGLKIIRGLYEKAVTADYLSSSPDQAETFLDYFWVHMRKQINHQKKVYKGHILTPEEVSDIENEYSRVKENFQEVLCKKCGTTKPQMSWTKLNTEAMALAANSPLGGMYYSCYFLPTLQTHTTVPAIFERLRPLEKEFGAYFSGDPQRDEAVRVLRNAHLIMLMVLDSQNEHFNLGLEDELWERAADLDSCWGLDGVNADTQP
jgi:hypothetical protein